LNWVKRQKVTLEGVKKSGSGSVAALVRRLTDCPDWSASAEVIEKAKAAVPDEVGTGADRRYSGIFSHLLEEQASPAADKYAECVHPYAEEARGQPQRVVPQDAPGDSGGYLP
jgi:hypothetical protein